MKPVLKPLDDIGTLCKLLDSLTQTVTANADGELFCMTCGQKTRMALIAPHGSSGSGFTRPPLNLPPNPTETDRNRATKAMYGPSLLQMTCLQCRVPNLALIYPTAKEGARLIIIPTTFAGVTTPNTPKSVGYYLDQAHRSHSMGANTAAVAMLRVALEHLLHDKGLEGMLGKQLATLEEMGKNGGTPKWAEGLDMDEMIYLKKLGNQALHTNNGDMSKQDGMDANLFRICSAIIRELLDAVYERPAALAHRKAQLARIIGENPVI
jgi:hypothetical protein